METARHRSRDAAAGGGRLPGSLQVSLGEKRAGGPDCWEYLSPVSAPESQRCSQLPVHRQGQAASCHLLASDPEEMTYPL